MGILRILFGAALLFFAGAFSALADQAVAKEMQKPGAAVPNSSIPSTLRIFSISPGSTTMVKALRRIRPKLCASSARPPISEMRKPWPRRKYHDGEGRKIRLSRTPYRKAVELGQAAAMANLAVMYFAGDGVARDMTEAVRLFRKAADLGNADATFNLALMYDNGAGVVQDQRKAAELIVSAIKMQYA